MHRWYPVAACKKDADIQRTRGREPPERHDAFTSMRNKEEEAARGLGDSPAAQGVLVKGSPVEATGGTTPLLLR